MIEPKVIGRAHGVDPVGGRDLFEVLDRVAQRDAEFGRTGIGLGERLGQRRREQFAPGLVLGQ